MLAGLALLRRLPETAGNDVIRADPLEGVAAG